MVVADNKERSESVTGILYSQQNHFQLGDDDRVNRGDVHDRDMCDGGYARDCVARCGSVLPSSATSRAPSQAIHS